MSDVQKFIAGDTIHGVWLYGVHENANMVTTNTILITHITIKE